MSRDELLQLFENNLSRMPIAESDFQATLEKGRRALGGYYDTYTGTWPRALFTEYAIRGVHLPLQSNDDGDPVSSHASLGEQ